MAKVFLYPTIVDLADIDFKKIDIEIGSGTLDSALFGVIDYGTIAGPSIIVNRVTGALDYSTTNSSAADFAGHNTGNVSLKGSAYSSSQLVFTVDVANYPSTLTDDTKVPDQVLAGAIFNYMVLAIFNGSTTGLDIANSVVRGNGLFFVDDPTTGMITDIDTKTSAKFARQITSTSDADEYNYWNFRTSEVSGPLETNSVDFSAGDKIYIKYSIDGQLIPSTADEINENNLTAISSGNSGTQLTGVTTPVSPFNNATVPITFILGWTVA
jgi:hypothetical protein